MFISSFQGAPASTDSVASSSEQSADQSSAQSVPHPVSAAGAACPLPPANHPAEGDYENVRHLVFGSLSGVRATISRLHTLRYAEPNDWSQPISTGRANEVMAILTQRMRIRA
ncbi:MAG: hypothetical protein WBC73_00005 [Phormidesmis sp.]